VRLAFSAGVLALRCLRRDPGRKLVSGSPFRPRRGVVSLTSQGHPRTIFRRALQHGNLLVAEATAREVGLVSLAEALELTILIAEREPQRHPRVAARWLRRYLDEHDRATIDDAMFIAAALGALRGDAREEAATVLRHTTGSRSHIER
jgi:hypothetical protein